MWSWAFNAQACSSPRFCVLAAGFNGENNARAGLITSFGSARAGRGRAWHRPPYKSPALAEPLYVIMSFAKSGMALAEPGSVPFFRGKQSVKAVGEAVLYRV